MNFVVQKMVNAAKLVNAELMGGMDLVLREWTETNLFSANRHFAKQRYSPNEGVLMNN